MNKIIIILTLSFIVLFLSTILNAAEVYLPTDTEESIDSERENWSLNASPAGSPDTFDSLNYSNKYTDNPLNLGEPLIALILRLSSKSPK